MVTENEDTKPYHGMLPPDKPSKTKQFVNDLNDRLGQFGLRGNNPKEVIVDDHSIMDEVEKELSKSLDNDPELQAPQATKYPDGNPKTTLGIAKPGDFKSPPIPLYLYSLAHMQGALKYGHYNWRDDPVSASTYLEAAKRHLDLYKEGQNVASDTGIHHLAHAMTCLSIIIDAEYYGSLIDDRKKDKAEEGKGAAVFEQFLADMQPLCLRIRQDWAGHAETHYNNKG